MAVSTLIPKISAEVKTAVPNPDSVEAADTGETPGPAQTEQANRAFLNSVQSIPGVLIANPMEAERSPSSPLLWLSLLCRVPYQDRYSS